MQQDGPRKLKGVCWALAQAELTRLGFSYWQSYVGVWQGISMEGGTSHLIHLAVSPEVNVLAQKECMYRRCAGALLCQAIGASLIRGASALCNRAGWQCKAT